MPVHPSGVSLINIEVVMTGTASARRNRACEILSIAAMVVLHRVV
ncbi:MAG: hypothetical protein AB7M05_15960 [Alphaproteobacteria bacterium]